MKKANLLSKAEMKKVIGGVEYLCPSDTCVIIPPGFYWDDLCTDGWHCESFSCADPLLTYNKCVLDTTVID